MDLRGATVVSCPENLYKGRNFVFEIHSGKMVLVCEADSQDDLHRWIAAIRRASGASVPAASLQR